MNKAAHQCMPCMHIPETKSYRFKSSGEVMQSNHKKRLLRWILQVSFSPTFLADGNLAAYTNAQHRVLETQEQYLKGH